MYKTAPITRNLRRSYQAKLYEDAVEQAVLLDVLKNIYGYSIVLTRCDNGFSINYSRPGSEVEWSTSVRGDDMVRWLWRTLEDAAKFNSKKAKR